LYLITGQIVTFHSSECTRMTSQWVSAIIRRYTLFMDVIIVNSNNNNNNIHICIAPYGRNFRGAVRCALGWSLQWRIHGRGRGGDRNPRWWLAKLDTRQFWGFKPHQNQQRTPLWELIALLKPLAGGEWAGCPSQEFHPPFWLFGPQALAFRASPSPFPSSQSLCIRPWKSAV